jgi:hypothetical protein
MSKFRSDATKWLLGALGGAVLTLAVQYALAQVHDWQTCRTTARVLIGDIRAQKARHAERLKGWAEHMQRLQNQQNSRGPNSRLWLMPEALESVASPIYANNTANLGLLGEAVAEEVSRFYSLSESLNAEIRILASPAVLDASRRDKFILISRNAYTQKKWDAAANHLLASLEYAQRECWSIW